jgi:hypothetical protein
MAKNRSRIGTMVGLAAAAGAFGVAVTMSAATAPAARADDFTDVINAVDGDLTAGQTEFGIAETDFGSSDVNDGLAAYFSGVDDDFVGAPNNLSLGTLDLLANHSVAGSLIVDLPPETDFTSGLTEAESLLSDSGGYFSDAAGALSSGDYVDAAAYDYYGSVYDAASFQVLLEGVVASF